MTPRRRAQPLLALLVLVSVPLLGCPKEEAPPTTPGGGVGASVDDAATDTTMTTDHVEPQMTDMETSTEMATDMATTEMGAETGGEGLLYRRDNFTLNGETLDFNHALETPGCDEQCQANDCEQRCLLRDHEGCVGWSMLRAAYYIKQSAQRDADPPMCYLLKKVRGWVPSACCIAGVPAGLAADATGP